ncbi:DNA polymerase III subunit gamma/tau, partial [Candidatus Gottesmanbacteria bacterium]|nr:DNA polymerase III subunit gamma/tau [Candidatus Gottesmanbacteria bacterium]
MSFYRKYRPQVFDEIDNTAVRERLLSLLNKEKKELPHAFLFTGPKGAGKTTAARLIAKLFNCIKPRKNGAPCGTCDSCRAIADGRYLDVLELDAASNRGIDEIRALRDTIALAPSTGTYKIYIIDEVHMLTTEAFNALLKTLEEPPLHAVFVLATTDPQKVPATIKSRCVQLNFGRAQTEELLHGLARVVKVEKIDIADDALALLVSYADGAFRDAMKLLEQVSFEKGKLTKEKVQKLLAASEEKTITTFFDALASKKATAGLAIVAQLVGTGSDIRSFITECLVECEHRLVASVTEKEAGPMTTEDLKELIAKLTQAYGDLRISPIPQLPLELAIVEYCGDSVISDEPQAISQTSTGLLTLEKLVEHWQDFIAAVKPYNNSIAGVLRSSRPKEVDRGIVT